MISRWQRDRGVACLAVVVLGEVRIKVVHPSCRFIRQAPVSCDPGCCWLSAYVRRGAMAQQAVIALMFVPISMIAYSTLAEGATQSISSQRSMRLG